VPLTIRLVIGRGWGQGPQHSQSLEALFAHIPGLKVVMPTTPAECKGVLLAAIDDDNPVMVLEHRWIHYVTGPVPEGRYAVPLDRPRLARPGNAVTVVATSYMLLEALRAGEALARRGCEAEIFDLRVLRPLNLAPILDSVRRTGRLLVCDTGWKFLGPGAEIVAQVAERALGALKAPPIRLGLPDHPTPSSRALAELYYPGSADVVGAIGELAGLDAALVAAAKAEVIASRGGVPIDKPDPAFKGPF
jgi:pyruvate dehydrogenase E1 component beta subunit